MRLGFFADGGWSHLSFDALMGTPGISVEFVCARFQQPDHILRERAEKHNIPFLIHKDINSAEFLSTLDCYKCDLLVSMSFDQIFREPIITRPILGVINCHAGKLPFYRGRNILNWALINDEKEFGITVHYVNQGVDTGDIIRQKCYPISDEDNYGTLLDRAFVGCADLLVESIVDISSGVVRRRTQREIHRFGSYCSARGPGDEYINWNQSSRQIFNFVRAICPPGPSARCFNNEREIKVKHVEFLKDAPCYIGIPGAVLSRDFGGLLVKTADSFVRLLDWEAEEKIRVGDRLT